MLEYDSSLQVAPSIARPGSTFGTAVITEPGLRVRDVTGPLEHLLPESLDSRQDGEASSGPLPAPLLELANLCRSVVVTGQARVLIQRGLPVPGGGTKDFHWWVVPRPGAGAEVGDLLLLCLQADGQSVTGGNGDLGPGGIEGLILSRAALDAERARYRQLFLAAPQATLLTDPAGRILEANASAAALLGTQGSLLAGRSLLDFVAERFRPDIERWISHAHDEGKSGQWEAALEPTEGEGVHVVVKASVVLDPERPDQLLGLGWEISDDTARHRAYQMLHQAREQLEEQVAARTAELQLAFEAQREAREIAEMLRSASLAINQSLSPQTVIETLMDYLDKVVPYERASVLLIAGERRLVTRSRGLQADSSPAHPTPFTAREFEASEFVQSIIKSRRSARLDEGAGLADQLPDARDGRGRLGVPLVVGTHVLGVFVLEKRAPGRFTEEQLRLAEGVAAQAAVSIQNAWLFEQVSAGRERLQFLSRRLVEVQENERRYIARELHDEAGQALTSIMMRLRVLQSHVGEPEVQLNQIAELRDAVNEVLENLHRLAVNLTPASLEHLGLKGALNQLTESFTEQHGIPVSLQIEGFGALRLAPDLETALYRFFQEALTNCARHSGATRVEMHLVRNPQRIMVRVEDNGAGFDPDGAQKRGRLGLLGLRERAELLGGTLTISSEPAKGTSLVMEIPYGDSYPHRR